MYILRNWESGGSLLNTFQVMDDKGEKEWGCRWPQQMTGRWNKYHHYNKYTLGYPSGICKCAMHAQIN